MNRTTALLVLGAIVAAAVAIAIATSDTEPPSKPTPLMTNTPPD